jgi:hypothetical protein
MREETVRVILSIVSLSLLLIVGCYMVADPLIRDNPEMWGAPTDGLQMSITLAPVAPSSEYSPEFYVAFRNVGPQDFFLNLGATLANGRNHFPTAIRLIITNEKGRSMELHHRGFNVAGRVDDYAVGIEVGSIHIVRISLGQFWCPETNEFKMKLPKGRYCVAAQFAGSGAHYKNTGQLWTAWNFWKGDLKSNLLEFEISQ